MPISIFPVGSSGSTAGLAPLDKPTFTGQINMPTWHTNARPVSGLVNGTGGFNLDTLRFELYSGAAWFPPVLFGDVATATANGLVPAPQNTDGTKFLRNDLTWQVPPASIAQAYPPQLITSSTNLTLTSNDRNIDLNRVSSPAPMTITLEASPANGSWHAFKDSARNCGTYPVTIVPAAGTIDGQANFVMDVDGLSVRLESNGTEWEITWFYNPNTVKGSTFAQLSSSGALLGSDKFVIDRSTQNLAPRSTDIAAYVNSTPAGSRLDALPTVLTLSDHNKTVELTGSAGLLSADNTLVDGWICDVYNNSTGDATYSGIVGLLGTTVLPSGYATTVFRSNGIVRARPPGGGTVTITTATTFTIAQSSAAGGIGSTDTFTLTPSGVWPAGLVITPAITGTGAATMSAYVPPSSNSSSPIVFTMTATGVGLLSIAFNNNQSMTPTPTSMNYTISSNPILTVASVAPTGALVTALASGTFSNGAPTSLSATINGAAITGGISSISITTTSGSGSSAAGTWHFNFANPATPGSYSLTVAGSGTYAGTSTPFSYTVVATTLTVSTITAPAPNSSFTVSGTNAGFTPSGLAYSTDSSNGTDGTWTTVGSPTISGTSWSYTMPGLAVGSYKIWVRDTVRTAIFGSSNTFVIANASGTITAPGSSTVNQPASFAVTESGSGNPTLYASVTSGGVEQTPRTTVPFATSAINMTPTAQALSTASLYTASSGGSALATSSSFTPAAASTSGYGQIQGTNPIFWSDFSDTSTLFSDTGRTVLQTTSGGAVQGVTDKSGNGIHLSQTTTGNAPTLAFGVQNGKSGLVFVAASSQFLNGNASSALTTLLTNLRAGDSTVLIIGKASIGQGGQPLGFLVHASTDDAGVLSVGTQYSNSALAGIRRNYYLQSAVDASTLGPSPNVLVKSVQTYNFTTKALTSQANSGTLASGAGPSGSDNATAWDALKVGRGHGASGGTPYFDGTIFEIVVWNAQASSAECTALITAMTAKWGS